MFATFRARSETPLGPRSHQLRDSTYVAVPFNNFDGLRFWAALVVLWSHAFPVSEGSERNEPLFALSSGQTTSGTIAVTFFFVISGYLITRSFDQRPDPRRFIWSRLLRIMPGLLVVLFAVTFVVGPIVSSVSLREYLSSPETYRYFFSQATFVSFYDELPGVFERNPMEWVNGSLWTLRHEVECYALVLLLGVLGLLKRWITLGIYVVATIVLAIADQGRISDGHSLAAQNQHLNLLTQFLAGALAYQFRLALRPSVAWICLGLAIACLLLGNFGTAQRTVVPYLIMVLSLGLRFRLPSLSRFGDLSYGIYIYAWPVKQLLVMNGTAKHWFLTAALATPVVMLLAFLSWHGVEKLALSLKDLALLRPAGLRDPGVARPADARTSPP
jgi:peptidoglycan/LPS O-acetylase OafA/YrhL